MDPALTVLSDISLILEDLGVEYVLVGSFASSMHGMYRATADIDILADISEGNIKPLFEALRQNYYVDEHAIREALTKRASFNAIHYESVFKIDVFIPKDDFSRAQLEHRLPRELPDRDVKIYVASAEDTILAKLNWYRSSDETSATQWNDVVGIFGANQSRLNLGYLTSWAEKLGLADLLERAKTQAS